MSNKKTLKMTKGKITKGKNSRRGKSRKGGFFGLFKDKHNEDPNCGDPNKLVTLKDSEEMFANYKQCCPKSWYGRKNNSPYCKKLDLNYKAAFQERQMETNANLQMLKTNQFQVDDDDGTISTSTIDCKNPELYNSETDIQRYIKICECSKSRWNPFSKKKENCGIVKKRLDDIINEPILKEQIYQEQQLEEQKRQLEEQKRQDQARERHEERSRQMIEIEREEKKRKDREEQNYSNILRKQNDKRNKIMDDYMKKYPTHLYDNYTREQLDRNSKEIIQNNINKSTNVEQFMIKYDPKDYGYTYEQLMINPKEVERAVKEKKPEVQYKKYQETLDPYDIEANVPFNRVKNREILNSDDSDTDGLSDDSDDYQDGGSKTKKHFRKRSIKKRKQKRRKTRKY